MLYIPLCPLIAHDCDHFLPQSFSTGIFLPAESARELSVANFLIWNYRLRDTVHLGNWIGFKI